MPAENQQQTLRAHLADPDCFATVLLVIFIDRYGMEGLQWTPQTIRMQLAEDFGTEPSDTGFDKLMAAITVVTTNYFYKNLTRFLDLASVLCGGGFDPTQTVEIDVDEAAWAITETMLLQPPDFNEDPEPFCDDIRHYLAAVLKRHGFLEAPDVLGIAIGADHRSRVYNDWADVPDVTAAIKAEQKNKVDGITSKLKSGLQTLIEELQGLPLQNGDTRNMSEKLMKAIRAEEKKPEPIDVLQ